MSGEVKTYSINDERINVESEVEIAVKNSIQSGIVQKYQQSSLSSSSVMYNINVPSGNTRTTRCTPFLCLPFSGASMTSPVTCQQYHLGWALPRGVGLLTDGQQSPPTRPTPHATHNDNHSGPRAHPLRFKAHP